MDKGRVVVVVVADEEKSAIEQVERGPQEHSAFSRLAADAGPANEPSITGWGTDTRCCTQVAEQVSIRDPVTRAAWGFTGEGATRTDALMALGIGENASNVGLV